MHADKTSLERVRAQLAALHDPSSDPQTRKRADDELQRFQRSPNASLVGLQALRGVGHERLQPHEARFFAASCLRCASKAHVDPEFFREAIQTALCEECDWHARRIVAQCAVVAHLRRADERWDAQATVNEIFSWRDACRCEAIDVALARLGSEVKRTDLNLAPDRREALLDILRQDERQWKLLEVMANRSPKEAFEHAAPIADVRFPVAHPMLLLGFDCIDGRLATVYKTGDAGNGEEQYWDWEEITCAASDMICSAVECADANACLAVLPRALEALDRTSLTVTREGRRAAFDVLAAIAVAAKEAMVQLLAESDSRSKWWSDVSGRKATEALLQVMLQGVDDSDSEIAMAALGFWSNIRATLENAKKSPTSGATGIFIALLQALLRRAQLRGEAVSIQSADARDLPEAERLVRREVGVELRLLASFLGPENVLQEIMKGLAEEYALWERKEALLYAANVVARRMQEREEISVLPDLVSAALNALQPGSHPKLAGTALTFVGGIPSFLSKHPILLRDVVLSVGRNLQENEPTLSRNAATAFQRIVSHEPCANLLSDIDLVSELLQIYNVMGAPKSRAGEYGDVSSEEMLLTSLSRLAAGLEPPLAETIYIHLCQESTHWVETVSKQGWNPSAIAGVLEFLPQKLNILAIVASATVNRHYEHPCTCSAKNMARLMSIIWPVVEASRGLLDSSLHSYSFLNRVDAAIALIDLLGSFLPLPVEKEDGGSVSPSLDPSTLDWMHQTMQQMSYLYHITEDHTLIQLLQRITDLAGSTRIRLALDECAESICRRALETLVNVEGCADAIAGTAASVLEFGRSWSTTFANEEKDLAKIKLMDAFAAPGMEARDRAVGEAALAWYVALCKVAARQNHPAISYLTSGVGASICNACFQAAAGSMPPWMVQSISNSLHQMWHILGFDFFGVWLRQSAIAFMRNRGMSKLNVIEAMADKLVSMEAWSDAKKFKAQIKTISGGKKKGQGGTPSTSFSSTPYE